MNYYRTSYYTIRIVIITFLKQHNQFKSRRCGIFVEYNLSSIPTDRSDHELYSIEGNFQYLYFNNLYALNRMPKMIFA